MSSLVSASTESSAGTHKLRQNAPHRNSQSVQDRMPESAGSVTLLTADSIYRQRLVIGEGGKQYLAVVLDLFSRFIVGSAVSACNDRHLTLKALKMALKRWRQTSGCCIVPA
jgi:transposase InsO family protein